MSAELSVQNLAQAIGDTPLIYLRSLSEFSGCEIYGKAEFMNPGGSVKDRTALRMIQDGVKAGYITKGTTVFEGTAGNTGIGIATLAATFGYQAKLVLPNNQANEKYLTLEALGAKLVKVPPCPFSDQNHFYHQARRLSEATPNAFWCNQFENPSNYLAHFETTGPEIWEQTQGKIDVFCASVGTGGTLAGVSSFLKLKKPSVKVALIDPMGSGLLNYVRNGEFKAEGFSVTEGIGIMRLTENFKKAKVDEALLVNDQEMIDMLFYLAEREGLLVGTSAALNVFGALQIAKKNKNSGLKIVTMLCDSALRYQSRILNLDWLKEKNLVPRLERVLA